jgi:hypothetical protein
VGFHRDTDDERLRKAEHWKKCLKALKETDIAKKRGINDPKSRKYRRKSS